MNNTLLIEVVRGRDGKRYPLPRPRGELARIRRLEHALVCRDRLSIRQAQATLLGSYAIKRSVGAIWKDLRNWSCSLPRCPAEPLPQDPPKAQPEHVAAVHHTAGPLTGSLTSMVGGERG